MLDAAICCKTNLFGEKRMFDKIDSFEIAFDSYLPQTCFRAAIVQEPSRGSLSVTSRDRTSLQSGTIVAALGRFKIDNRQISVNFLVRSIRHKIEIPLQDARFTSLRRLPRIFLIRPGFEWLSLTTQRGNHEDHNVATTNTSLRLPLSFVC